MKHETPLRQTVAPPTSSSSTDPAEGLHEPLPAELRSRLRQAVVDQARTAGRTARPLLHVGEPGGLEARIALDDLGSTDPGLRTDLVSTMLDTAGSGLPLVWLSRSGDLALQDVDAVWLAAARAAAQESARSLVMVVVTRRGWHDPRSGLTRSWVRLRMPRARCPD